MARGKLARVVIGAALTLSVLPACGRFFFDWSDPEGKADANFADASSDGATDALVLDATSADDAMVDANVIDANITDAPATDSSTLDANVTDAATTDADMPDSASAEAGQDASADAGGCATTNCGCVRFVSAVANSQTQDGLTWATAFITMQPAIDSAAAAAMALGGNAGCEVWVRAGSYVVFQTSVTDTITMRPRVDLYGGFAGGETDRNSRDPSTKVTILDGNELAVMNPRRVTHVVTGTGPARIDGFTITGGHAVGSGVGNKGGGLISSGAAAPLVVDCTFENNDAPGSVNARGGGAAFVGTGRGVLRGCRFVNNSAERGGGLYVETGSISVFNTTFDTNITSGTGGAIYVRLAEIEIAGSRFTGNQSNLNGGAFASEGNNTHSVRIESSRFDANTTGGNGGAIWVDSEPLELENVVMSGNTAGGNGGGVAVTNPQLADINGVTIGNNTAGGNGAGLHAACPLLLCSIKNSILWNPGTSTEVSVSGMTFFSRSIVRGGAPGGTFIVNANPMFLTTPLDLALAPGSPAIDAADGCDAPPTDYLGNGRVDNTTVNNTGTGPPADMGAVEFQLSSTAAPWNLATCCGPGTALPSGSMAFQCAAEVPWNRGRAFCALAGGTLVSIADAPEAALVGSITLQTSWIGLHRTGPLLASYVWEDGSPLNFNAWGAAQPTGGNEQCVSIQTNSTWFDDACVTRHSVICEVP